MTANDPAPAASALRRPRLDRRVLLLAAAYLAAVIAGSLLLPDELGADWRKSFYPAARLLLQGQDPYQVDQFLLAPWSLAVFVPLALLPARAGTAVLLVTGLCVYAYVAVRLKASPIGLAAILLSPQILHNLINANVDWLALLGFVLPPQVGLFFLALKPQIGLPLALFWGVEALREKRLLRTFAPFTALLLVSFGLFGLWPLKFSAVQPEYNASLWPASLPFGVVLLISALYRRRERLAQAIGPFFSPHVMFHSWSTLLYALAPDTVELVCAVVVSWAFFIWSASS
ncbi:MAG: hypothetical protein ACKOC5_11630 [Chloroflexota bacterium]